MPALDVTLILLLGAVVGLAFSRRLRQPVEVVLLIGSLLISFLPAEHIRIDPDIIFSLFLPPVLFAAAYFTSWNDFVRNIRAISLLAVGLVVTTTLVIAATVRLFFPEMPWPCAFLLGAIVAPPDASAAVALIRQFRLPRKLITIIEGESLINDASALTCYRFALLALTSGTFELSGAMAGFGIVAVGGALVGIAIAFGALTFIRRLGNTNAETLTSILTAFFCYRVAEHLHLSGVMATVAAGIFFGRALPERISSHTRLAAKGVWDIFLFCLNALIFTIIGLQLPVVVGSFSWAEIFRLGSVSVVLYVFLVLVRFLWVFPAAAIPRYLSAKIRARDPMPSWQALTILGWAGMRGIVSLAAALALPFTLPDGQAMPYRNEIIFMAYAVTVLSLLVPTFTLSRLVEKLGIRGGDESQREESLARLKISDSVIHTLTQWQTTNDDDERRHVDGLLDGYKRHREMLKPTVLETPYSQIDLEVLRKRDRLLKLIEVERHELGQLRRSAVIHDEVYHHLAQELDLEELRLEATSRPNL